jgi:hypothetical protein
VIALLSGLVDDAGLFPPSSMSLPDALARHRVSRSPMLTGRFLLPPDRVPELLGLLAEDEKLEVHLVGGSAEVDDPRITVRAVEARGPVPGHLPCYVEGVAPAELAGRGYFGKVRCSEITVADLTSYVVSAARLSLPFKATAGLHHAVRSDAEHGYLNLVLAVARALSDGDVAEVLGSTDADALAAEARELSGDLVTATRWLFHSYGSCDTAQPVEDAHALGLA